MMEIGLLAYFSASLFLLLRSQLTAYRETKRSECTKKFETVEYYECEAEDYYAFKLLNGKRFLFVGEEPNSHAYYHELGHLVFDRFWLDPFLESLLLIPLFLLPVPWAWIGAFFAFVTVKWVKKNWERRADIFAFQMTGEKYIPTKPEEGKLQLLFRWLFWSHPPEKVRVEEEYYKKEVPLIRLFFKSLLT
jgi:hypothetical protein